MSSQIIEFVVAGILILQGLSHGKAGLDLMAVANGRRSAGDNPVRIRLLPSLTPKTSALIAGIIWILATVGFVVAGLGLLGAADIGTAWRPLAGVSAVVSTLGIVLIGLKWPAAPNKKLSNADTIIALVINAAVIILLVIAQWPL